MRVFELADKLAMNRAFGTNILSGGSESQGRQLQRLARFMSPLTALDRTASTADCLLALSGEGADYDGRCREVSAPEFAVLLVINAPREIGLDRLADSDNLRLTFWDGRVMKNACERG